MRLIPAAFIGLAACSDPRVLSLDITTGHETDAFSRDPAVTQVSVTAVAADGSELLTTSAAPGGSFDLGELPVDQLVHIEVNGRDAAGDVRVRGRSLAVVVGGLESEVLPVFAERLEGWSRPPGELPHSHVGGLGAVIGERYLMLTGGEGSGDEAGSVAFYDMLAWGGASGGTIAFVPRSLAVSADGSTVLLIDDEHALWLDFDSGTSGTLAPPEGLGSWGAVAGGRTVVGPNASYIVGSTRADPPSDRVVVLAADGTLASVALETARAGAAATWVDEVGLVIAGGAEEGAGVEVLAEGASEPDALDFAADPTRGATAAVGAGDEELVLFCGADAAGNAPSRLLDLGCGHDCAAEPLAGEIGVVSDCFAHRDGDQVLVTGTDADGLMASFKLAEDGAVVPLPLREARRGGVAIAAPNGTLALVGGESAEGEPILTVEMYFPSE